MSRNSKLVKSNGSNIQSKVTCVKFEILDQQFFKHTEMVLKYPTELL